MKRGGRIARGLAWIAVLAGLLVTAAALYIHLPGGRERLETRFALPAYVPIDFATLRKTARPNQFLVLPNSVGVEAPDRRAPVFDKPAGELAALWRRHVAAGDDVAERRWDAASLSGDYVERTRLMRFPDLISVRFYPLGVTRSTLAIYSRSVYGYSDRGVNHRRVGEWLDRLEAAAKAG